MKIRNGFVSNSSSSSFLLVVSEDSLMEALGNDSHPFLQFVVDKYAEGPYGKFGAQVRVVQQRFCSEDYEYYWEDYDGPEWSHPKEEWYHGGKIEAALLDIVEMLGGEDSPDVLLKRDY